MKLNAEVMNATKKQPQRFEHSHRFNIVSNNNIPDQVIAAPYLRKVQGEYEIICLGRNGEPYGKRPVKVALRHRLRSKYQCIKLTTNKEGLVKLGPLKDVTSVIADTVNTYVANKHFSKEDSDQDEVNPRGGNIGSSCKEWLLEHYEGEKQVYW